MPLIFANSYETPSDQSTQGEDFFSGLFGGLAKGIQSGYQDAKEEKRYQNQLKIAWAKVQQDAKQHADEMSLGQQRVDAQSREANVSEQRASEQERHNRAIEENTLSLQGRYLDKQQEADTNSENYGMASSLQDEMLAPHANPLHLARAHAAYQAVRSKLPPKDQQALNRQWTSALENTHKAQLDTKRTDLANQLAQTAQTETDPVAQQDINSLSQSLAAGAHPDMVAKMMPEIAARKQKRAEHVGGRQAALQSASQRLQMMGQKAAVTMDDSDMVDFAGQMQAWQGDETLSGKDILGLMDKFEQRTRQREQDARSMRQHMEATGARDFDHLMRMRTLASRSIENDPNRMMLKGAEREAAIQQEMAAISQFEQSTGLSMDQLEQQAQPVPTEDPEMEALLKAARSR